MSSQRNKTSLIAASVCLATTSLIAQSHKNILFIAVDDLKPLLACYGDPIAKTPNIDRLASRGVVFTQAYCQQAVSGPSRASLLTGMCPDRTQVWDLKTLIRDKNPEVITLPEHFKKSGYQTYGIGKIYDPRSVDKKLDERSWAVPFAELENFYNPQYGEPAASYYQLKETKDRMKEYEEEAIASGKKGYAARAYALSKIKPATESADVPDDAYADGAIVKGAIEYIEKCDKTKPQFWAVGFKKPHLPFCAPTKYWDLYKREDMPLAEYREKAVGSPDIAYHKSEELMSYTDIPALSTFSDIRNREIEDNKARELIHGYYACVSYMDAQVGKLLDALDRNGLTKNTIIVFWGDHGWHLGDHGLWCKHTNFEQATHVPMIIVDPSMPAKKSSHPVEFLDLYPTLCDLANITIPNHVNGVSLRPLMKGETPKDFRPYASSQYPRGTKMGYSIRSEHYRYTVWVDWKEKQTNPYKVVAEELYDYQKDPLETRNLIDDKAYSSTIKQMKEYWKDYIKRRVQ